MQLGAPAGELTTPDETLQGLTVGQCRCLISQQQEQTGANRQ
jgi:hypothetical protein